MRREYKIGLSLLIFAGVFLFAHSVYAGGVDVTWVVTDGFEIFASSDLTWDADGPAVCTATLGDYGAATSTCSSGTIQDSTIYRVQVVLKEGTAETSDIIWAHATNDYVVNVNVMNWAGAGASSTICKFYDGFGAADDTAADTDCSIQWMDFDDDAVSDDLKLTCSTCAGGGSPKLIIANDGEEEGFMYLIETGTVSTDEYSYWTEKNGDEQTSNTVIITAGVVSPSDLEQAAYRFYTNTDSTDVGRATMLNSPATIPPQGTPFRMRLLLHVTTNELGINGTTSDLQYARRSGTCDTGFVGESWNYITNSSAIRFYDNTTPGDGTALTENYQDPRHASTSAGSDLVDPQDYEDADGTVTFSNTESAIPVGRDGMWDFALVNLSAASSTSYCLRAVQDEGGLLSGGYSVVPEIKTASETKIRIRGTVRLRVVRLR